MAPACDGCDSDGGDAPRAVPAAADGAVVVPSLDRLRVQLDAFLAGVEGASGVFDLVRGRLGLDLTTARGLRDAGIAPSGGAALFREGRTVGVALPLASAARLAQWLDGRVAKAVGATASPVPEDAPPGLRAVWAGPLRGERPAWRAAWGVRAVGSGAVAVLAVGPPGGDDGLARLVETYAAWTAEGAGHFVDGEDAAAARESAGADAVAWAAGKWRIPTPPGLGLAALVVTPFLAALETWRVTLHADDNRLRLGAHLRWTGAGDLGTSWFQPRSVDEPRAATPAPLTSVMPKASTLIVRGRFDPGAVESLPKAVRSAILPRRWPGLPEAVRVPSPSSLLQRLTGDVAVGVMGLAPDTSVGAMLRDVAPLLRAGGLRPSAIAKALFRHLHLAAAVEATSADGAASLVDDLRRGLEAAGWEGDAVAPREGARGWALVSEDRKASVGLLVEGRVVVAVWGRGELERFLAVGEGRAVPLTALAAADGETGRAAVLPAALGEAPEGGAPSTLGMVATFGRVTRELGAMGLPPFFLRMLADVRSVSVTLDVRADGLHAGLEVGL